MKWDTISEPATLLAFIRNKEIKESVVTAGSVLTPSVCPAPPVCPSARPPSALQTPGWFGFCNHRRNSEGGRKEGKNIHFIKMIDLI